MPNEKRSTCGVRETSIRPLVMMTALSTEVSVLTSCLVRGTKDFLPNELSKFHQQWHDLECMLQMQDLRAP